VLFLLLLLLAAPAGNPDTHNSNQDEENHQRLK
jgi:hypothetical protein